MDTLVTSRVDSHHTNKKYECLLVDLLSNPTFHFQVVNGRLVKADLMPTDQFVLDLCHYLSKQSPTFRKALSDLVMSLDFEDVPERPVRTRKADRGRILW